MTSRHRFLAARAAYVVIVLLATLSNLGFVPDGAAAAARLQHALSPSLSWRDAIDGLRNVVLFAGFGAVWVLTSITGRLRQEIGRATLASLALSATVEALQLFSPVRNASMMDVFTNTLGGLGGALATVALIVAVGRARGEKSYVGIPTLLIAGPYAAATLCEALAPLFHSDPANLSGGPLSRLEQLLRASWIFEWSEIPVTDVPLFAAAGFLLVALARERRATSRREWPPAMVAGAGALAVVVAHVLHGAAGLVIRWEGAITDALALAAGAWGAARWLGPWTQRYRGAARARAVLVSCAALLLVWAWRPLMPETRWSVIAAQVNATSLTPLAGLAERVDVFSALHVAQQFLLYLPAGALLAVWPLRLRGRLAHLWPGLAFAAALELGHIVMTGRSFDITNFLLAAAGLATGWIIVRRCGYQPYGESWPAAPFRVPQTSRPSS